MKLRNIRISEFGYGRTTNRLKSAVKWLNRHKHIYNYYFDWPDYYYLPKTLSSELSPDEVDFIQNETFHWVKEDEI